MKTLFKLLPALAMCLGHAAALAQSEVPMADEMRANGKIYVVVAIVVVILIGLLTYVLIVDRKITRLERKLDEK